VEEGLRNERAGNKYKYANIYGMKDQEIFEQEKVYTP